MGVEKGCHYPSYTKAVLCWKHYLYSVFSKHSNYRGKGVSCTGTENLPKIVGRCSRCKSAFNSLFLLFFGLVFIFLVSVFCKEPKRHLSCNLKGFFLTYSPHRPVFKILLFLFFVFFFLLTSFQNCIFVFFPFSSSTPFGRTFCFLHLLYLSFPFPFFKKNASFLQTNFPDILFQTQVAFIFGCLVLVLLVVCFGFVVLVVSVVLLSNYEKCCLACNFGVFWCNVGSKPVLQFRCWILCFGYAFGSCSWSWNVFCAVFVVQGDTVDSLLVLDIFVHVFIFYWFVFPYQEQAPKAWNSKTNAT